MRFLLYAQGRVDAIDLVKSLQYVSDQNAVSVLYREYNRHLIEEAKNGSYNLYRTDDAYIKSQSPSGKGT